MDDDETIDIDGTSFSRAQVDRQTNRIYEFVFVEPRTDDDGNYGGRITDEVLNCFHSNLIFDEIVGESAVSEMIAKIVKDLKALIIENVTVHPFVATAFCQDFVPACMDQFFTIQSSPPPASDFDPAYG